MHLLGTGLPDPPGKRGGVPILLAHGGVAIDTLGHRHEIVGGQIAAAVNAAALMVVGGASNPPRPHHHRNSSTSASRIARPRALPSAERISPPAACWRSCIS